MTKEEIIPSRTDVLSMAREAGFLVDNDAFQGGVKLFERFFQAAYAAGAAAEREACAKLCESLFDADDYSCDEAEKCAAAIRARGETSSREEA